ncbi:hypothetical protein [Epinotia aporema granulovirus]|uniref:Uncharacterized protein n=1 Tax=Epinotia aporema granulovirus TaxID=166056 RepID=K4EQS5_9BBAC|nr:hypothetical protein [Epinotia aporema granulovirus]AER41446.1 hypothetical protein [Epinotia aporema granulovirus]
MRASKRFRRRMPPVNARPLHRSEANYIRDETNAILNGLSSWLDNFFKPAVNVYSPAEPEPPQRTVRIQDLIRERNENLSDSDSESESDDDYQPTDSTYEPRREQDDNREQDDDELVDIEFNATVIVPPGMTAPNFEFFTRTLIHPETLVISDDEDATLRNAPPSSIVVDRVFNDNVFPDQFFNYIVDCARYFSDDHNIISRYLIHKDINHKFITNWARGDRRGFFVNSKVYNEIRRLRIAGKIDVNETTLEHDSTFHINFCSLIRSINRMSNDESTPYGFKRFNIPKDLQSLHDETHSITAKSIIDFPQTSPMCRLYRTILHSNIYKYTFDVTDVPHDLLNNARFIVYDSDLKSFYRNVSRPFLRHDGVYVSLYLLNAHSRAVYLKLFLVFVKDVVASDIIDIEDEQYLTFSSRDMELLSIE